MSHIGWTRVLLIEGMNNRTQRMPQTTFLSASTHEKAIDSSLGQGNQDINNTKLGHPD